jgi:hypothetical protein
VDPEVLHTNPNVPIDEDGTGSEAIFAGLNDEHVLLTQAKSLVGNSEILDGAAETITPILPLVINNRQLYLDQSSFNALLAGLQSQVTALQARATADEAQITANATAITGNTTTIGTALLAITILQQQVATLNQQLQDLTAAIKPSALNPYGRANFGGSGRLGANLGQIANVTSLASLAGAGGLAADMGKVPKVLSPGSVAGVGNLAAVLNSILAAPSNLAGAGQLSADSLVKSLVVKQGDVSIAGAGNLVAPKFTAVLTARASLVGAGGLLGSTSLLQSLRAATLAGAGGMQPAVLAFGFSALNPAKKAPSLILSNNNRTVTEATDGIYGTVAGTRARTTGDGNKYYFEARLDNFASGTASSITGIGICTSADTAVGTDTSGIGNTATSWGLTSVSGSYVVRNNATNLRFPGGAMTNGDIMQVAVDCAVGTGGAVYFGFNGFWPGGGGFNPGLSDASLPPTTVILLMAGAIRVSGVTDQITINIGNAAFAFTPPAGFVAWG